MVKITLNKILIDGPLAGQISATLLNTAAENYAGELAGYLNGKVCAAHPRQNQKMIVTADVHSKLLVEKVDFCCEKFKESIDFVPK